jgi:hypothetical protein
MVGKKNCVCCGKRLVGDGKRPVAVISLHLFVSARLFPSPIPDESFICTTCRFLYKKWMQEFEFGEILSKIDGSSDYVS